MKKIIKKVYKSLYKKYLFENSTKAFKRRYKKYDQNLFSNTLSSSVIEEYKQRWSRFGVKVETNTFTLCHNLSGNINFDIVPENIFAVIIEKKLNPYKELSFFSVKNIYEKWFDNKEVFPVSYLHKIDGVFYDSEFKLIKDLTEFVESSKIKYPLILKPSKDTYGGTGVTKIKNKNELLKEINKYRHFVCQELILQNDYLALINNSSVNSVRSCLYRDSSGSFRVLNNSMRFGINGGLDNETAGGIVCNIDDSGELSAYAVDKYGNKFIEHPNSKLKFNSIKVPFYDELNKLIVEIANQIPLCNLISLDMCLDNQNNWRCLELNLSGQTIRFAQYAGKGFFGEYTDEVIKRTAKSNQ